MWWGYPGHAGWGFGFMFFIFFVMMVGSFIFRTVVFRRHFGHFGHFGYCGRNGGWYDESETILRKRLVNGEIDETEYEKLKDILKR